MNATHAKKMVETDSPVRWGDGSGWVSISDDAVFSSSSLWWWRRRRAELSLGESAPPCPGVLTGGRKKRK